MNGSLLLVVGYAVGLVVAVWWMVSKLSDRNAKFVKAFAAVFAPFMFFQNFFDKGNDSESKVALGILVPMASAMLAMALQFRRPKGDGSEENVRRDSSGMD